MKHSIKCIYLIHNLRHKDNYNRGRISRHAKEYLKAIENKEKQKRYVDNKECR